MCIYIMLIYKWKCLKNYEYVGWTRGHVYRLDMNR